MMKNIILAFVSLCVALTECATNLALNKETKMSSLYTTIAEKYINGGRAVDNNKNSKDSAGNYICAHTGAGDDNPYWAVDLGGVYLVTDINVFSRKDCCEYMFSNLKIEVIKPDYNCNSPEKWTDLDTGEKTLCHFQKEGVSDLKIKCPPNTVGRFVKIQRTGTYMSLCEVEVYGKPANLALNKETKMSSLYTTIAEKYINGGRAVDNNKNSKDSAGNFICAHTGAGDSNPYWAVDLGQKYLVTDINVFSRKDCCEYQFSNLKIEVIQPDFNSPEKWTDLDTGEKTLCHFQKEGVSDLKIKCPPNTVGRFVKIQRSGTYMSLCEVEVYALP